MDSVVSVLSWIWYNFFDRAAMFMMVLVFIGQLLTKRPFLESLMGALKAYIGYIVYQTATGGLYTTFQPIMMGLRQVLGMNIIVNDDSLGAGTLTAILESFGRTTSLQMASMAAGFGIAMGNAMTTVQAIADYVTADIDQDGLAQAINRALTHFADQFA